MYDWAKPGVKVVCVNAFDNISNRPKIDITEGQIYTLRDVLFYQTGGVNSKGEWIFRTPEELCVRLDEVRVRFTHMGVPFEDVDAPFCINRFKPLVSKSLPESLTCLLKNPKSIILPNEGNRWDVRKQPQKVR
ncbi:hypothetical protein EVB99_015 [Rhizobium phage RHph_N3_19]|nr:hypothetical protein EVB99_015 [Rhizobium phage RHph_N3_19]